MVKRGFAGLLVALVGVGLAAGCGTSSKSEKVGASQEEIQGGTTDTTHTFEMGLCVGSQCNEVCTATLIAPNLVVTARHCVVSTPLDTVDCATTNFSGNRAGTSFYVTSNVSLNS